MCGTSSGRTHVLRPGIVLHLSGHVLVFNDRRRLVFLQHGGMLNRRRGSMPPTLVIVLAFVLLLSDGSNISSEQPQAQSADQRI